MPYTGGAGRTMRTTVGNAAYTIKSWDDIVALTATPTVNRTWTLPPANSVPSGKSILLIDQSGGGIVVGGAFIVLAAAGSDVLNISEATLDLETPNFIVQAISDGTSKWVVSLSTFEEVTDFLVHRFLDVTNNASFGAAVSVVGNAVLNADLSVAGATTTAAITASGLITCSASFRQTGAANSLGYYTGAGGAVTQATNKTTAVTLDKPTGAITMNNAALAAGASVEFTVNNSLSTVRDVVIVAGVGTISAGYRIEAVRMGNNAFNIRVTNITAGSLSEALVINFALIHGVNS